MFVCMYVYVCLSNADSYLCFLMPIHTYVYIFTYRYIDLDIDLYMYIYILDIRSDR